MKVTLPKDYKDIYTVSQVEVAKKVIASAKADEDGCFGDIKEWAMMASRALAEVHCDYCERVLEASAEVAGNSRIDWDGLCDGSQRFDIWISFTAETSNGFIKGGAYLTDIWNISGSTHDTDNMYARYYAEKSC